VVFGFTSGPVIGKSSLQELSREIATPHSEGNRQAKHERAKHDRKGN
jgi:hypothetical protein